MPSCSALRNTLPFRWSRLQVDCHLLSRCPVVTNPPVDVALAPLIVALAAAGVVTCLHVADSRAVALTVPLMHPDRNASFA
jgi:hypothetical protein